MDVLITGASGFLGRYVCRKFIEMGHKVVPLGIVESGMPNEIICNLETVDRTHLASKIKGIDLVVHLAAKVDFSNLLSTSLFKVNTIGTYKLAKVAQDIDAKFIFASAILIHGITKTNINKNTKDNPDTPYMMSKWIAEELIKDTHQNVATLRIAGIFGLNGPRHLFLNNSIRNAVMKHVPPKLIGKGIAKRNYIYVKDVANWIYYIAENDLKGTFYLAGKDVLNIKKMAESICEVFLGSKIPERVDGTESHDQVCEISEPHPYLFSFIEALRDIKIEYEKNSSYK